MVFDKTVKVNEMARELIKHGLASDMDEACKKAECMVKGSSEVIKEECKDKSDSSLKEQFEIALERMQRSIARELQNISERLTSVENGLNDARRSIAARARQEVNPVKSSDSEKVVEGKEEQKELPKETVKDDEIKPEDVAVEKIFYYGKK